MIKTRAKWKRDERQSVECINICGWKTLCHLQFHIMIMMNMTMRLRQSWNFPSFCHQLIDVAVCVFGIWWILIRAEEIYFPFNSEYKRDESLPTNIFSHILISLMCLAAVQCLNLNPPQLESQHQTSSIYVCWRWEIETFDFNLSPSNPNSQNEIAQHIRYSSTPLDLTDPSSSS